MFKRYPFYVLFLTGAVFFTSSSFNISYAQDNEPLTIEEVEADEGIPNLGELNTVDAEEDAGASNGQVSISAPSVMADNMDEDLFFDANDIVPQGEMARQGPVPVNPAAQPASKFITVTKNKSANSVDAKYVAAQRAMTLGRYDSALNILDALYERNSGNARIVMGRATTLQKLGRFDEAMQMYEKLSKIEPHNIDVKVNMLGLLSTRYPSVALRRLIDLHSQYKSHVGVTAQLAVAYAQAGDADSALSYLGAAASMDPHNANHLFNMAVIADRAGYKDDAVKYYERALEVDTIHGAGRSIPRDSVYQRLAQIR